MKLLAVLLTLMPVLVAGGLYLGTADRPARYHGLATMALVDGSSCFAAVRVEDLPGRGYVNRWHYVLQVAPGGCALVPFGPEVRHHVETAVGDSQTETVFGWGQLLVQPIDPEVRNWNVAASAGPMDYPDGTDSTVTFRSVDGTGNVWELLIEQSVGS